MKINYLRNFQFYLVASLFVMRIDLVQAQPAAGSVGLHELLQVVESKSPEFKLQRLEAEALRRRAQGGYAKILPELGVEGGGRSSREREQRNDIFYYGYARYELSLGDIAQLRTSFNRSDLGALAQRQAGIRAHLAIISAYYRVLAMQKQLALKMNDFNFADKQLAAARKRVNAGLSTDSDILEFKMHQRELENDLRILKKEFELELRELERTAGLGRSVTSVNEDFIFKEDASSFDQIWSVIAKENFELRLAKVEAIAAKSERVSALGEFLPRISAEGQYGKLMETDFVESRKNSWEVVGKVTIPLFNGGSSWNRYQEKSAIADRASLSASQEEARLRNVAQNLYEKILELKEKLNGEVENVGFAEKYFEMVMSEYRRGVKNSPDVASATDKLFEARWRLFKTKIELSLGTAELLAMQGKSL